MNLKTHYHQLDELHFDNRFIQSLPGDPLLCNQRRQVSNACYSKVMPTKVSNPRCIAFAPAVADLLNLSPDSCTSAEFTQIMAGNQLAKGMEAYATCYGGHQFGHWAGQLGDGRAINLGEVINQQGQRWALQLKGAGPTPYSRSADGLAVLRSSLREFLCSEAMFHLGVPTTRALSLVTTGEQVLRDMFYNGNPQHEPGAIVCRVAPSFTRFGHFQILTARNEYDNLQALLDYTINTDFPHLGTGNPTLYLPWFEEVCRRTMDMIVHWQRVGFVHGVMNTDNMSILGLTIDYGPYGWLENYDPGWTPNTTDAGERRYRFGNQAAIAFWNLGQLANAIYPLIKSEAPLREILDRSSQHYVDSWQTMLAQKLGLLSYQASSDESLINDLLALLGLIETDMTIFFRRLALIDIEASDLISQAQELLADAFYVPAQITADYQQGLARWLERYCQRLREEGLSNETRRSNMNAVNPCYVLRNYLAQQAIDKAEQEDFSLLHELQQLLSQPYTEQDGKQGFAEKRPDWARQRAGCSMLSCSS